MFYKIYYINLSQLPGELSKNNRKLLKIKDFFIKTINYKVIYLVMNRFSNVKALYFPLQEFPCIQGLSNLIKKRR